MAFTLVCLIILLISEMLQSTGNKYVRSRRDEEYGFTFKIICDQLAHLMVEMA